MRLMYRKISYLVSIFGFSMFFAKTDTLRYELGFENAKDNLLDVKLKYKSPTTGVVDFKMSQWTPGYYQVLDFSKNVINIQAKDKNGNVKEVVQIGNNTWRISAQENEDIVVQYQVLAKDYFIAKPYINKDYAFVRPTGVFIFPNNGLDQPSLIQLKKHSWGNVATGLDQTRNGYVASNIDQLLDSPILLGDLDVLGSFEINGKKHYVAGRDFNDFDTKDFMESLQKIVKTATDLMGHIPYDHYSFISLGKGNGGIEQTNSTVFTFNGEGYKTEKGRQKLLDFVTHEYFHHYNVKRIRPIELGPFDYDNGSKTRMLWFAEGLTVYYEWVIMNRAGLKTPFQMKADWAGLIGDYENNEGKNYQTLADASFYTWEDGPFGIKGKTISNYVKGPIIGMLLDLKIRSNTNNQKSIDDVMRYVYNEIYLKENRGYTEKEIKEICEKFAGENLDEIFSYIYEIKPIEYNEYFSLGGLKLIKNNVDGKEVYIIEDLPKMSNLQKKINKDLFR